MSAPKDFKDQYHLQLKALQKNSRGFEVYEKFMYNIGNHPTNYIDSKCEFAAHNLAENNPTIILDIDSYRHFILGLLASYKVTTLDVCPRISCLANETVLTRDAKQLDIPSASIDAVALFSFSARK